MTLLTNADAQNPHYISPRDVLPKAGLIDDCIEYPSELGFVTRTAALFKLSLKLRKRNFDAVIYLMPRLRSAAQIDRDINFFSASGLKKVIGAEFLRQNLLPDEIPKPIPAIERESDFLLRFLSHEGLSQDRFEPRADLLLTDEETASARKVFQNQNSIDIQGKKLVAIAPGSKWPSKIWGEENYATVGRRLIVNDNCYPIIVGGSEDKEKGDRLLALWKTGCNMAGLLNVRQSAALLKDCDLYLGNDTGTMHLAGAVGTPCVAIFAAIDWKDRWYPFGDRNIIFRKSVECEGCLTPNCFNQHKCLKLVTVDEVYKACSKTIAREE